MNGDALRYHEAGRPGKLAIRATKPLANQRDLALAYLTSTVGLTSDRSRVWSFQ